MSRPYRQRPAFKVTRSVVVLASLLAIITMQTPMGSHAERECPFTIYEPSYPIAGDICKGCLAILGYDSAQSEKPKSKSRMRDRSGGEQKRSKISLCAEKLVDFCDLFTGAQAGLEKAIATQCNSETCMCFNILTDTNLLPHTFKGFSRNQGDVCPNFHLEAMRSTHWQYSNAISLCNYVGYVNGLGERRRKWMVSRRLKLMIQSKSSMKQRRSSQRIYNRRNKQANQGSSVNRRHKSRGARPPNIGTKFVKSGPRTSALMAAAKKCDLVSVTRLISSGINIQAKDGRGRTALHHACTCNDHKKIKSIVNAVARACSGKNSCIDDQDHSGITPLAVCIGESINGLQEDQQYQYVLAVQSLLSTHGADPNIPDIFHHTPLMMATRAKLINMVDALLQNVNPKINPNSTDSKPKRLELELVDFHGNTAMMYAAEWFTLVNSIGVKLEAEQNVGKITNNSAFFGINSGCSKALHSIISPFHTNSSKGVSEDLLARALTDCGFFTRVVKKLLSAGAQINTTNARGETALHVAHPYMLQQMQEHIKSLTANENGIMPSNRKEVLGQQWESAMHRTSLFGVKPSLSGSWATRTHLLPLPSRVILSGSSRNSLNKESRPPPVCDIPSMYASDISPEIFREEFIGGSRPLLILDGMEGDAEKWERLGNRWGSSDWLIRQAGFKEVMTGTIPYAFQFGVPYKDVTLAEFLSDPNLGGEAPLDALFSENFTDPRPYLFHPIGLIKPWDDELGRTAAETLAELSKLLSGDSFFMPEGQIYFGRQSTGSPMHFHGNAINLLLRGRKQWFLLPPGTAHVSKNHPLLWSSQNSEYADALHCEQPEGSTMFIPRGWSHAVLNTAQNGPTVGVALEFVDMGSSKANKEHISRMQNLRFSSLTEDLHRIFPI